MRQVGGGALGSLNSFSSEIKEIFKMMQCIWCIEKLVGDGVIQCSLYIQCQAMALSLISVQRSCQFRTMHIGLYMIIIIYIHYYIHNYIVYK